MSQKERLRAECEMHLNVFMSMAKLNAPEQTRILNKQREWFVDLEKSFDKEQEVKTFPKNIRKVLQVYARNLDIKTQLNLLDSLDSKLKELLSLYPRFGRN